MPFIAQDRVHLSRGASSGAAKSGLAETVCGFTVNKVCGSGLKSVALAAQAIQAGQAQSIVAGVWKI